MSVIEHNLDVIKSADLHIDLGPEGGTHGGRVVACGTPKKLRDRPFAHGQVLRPLLNGTLKKHENDSKQKASKDSVSTRMRMADNRRGQSK